MSDVYFSAGMRVHMRMTMLRMRRGRIFWATLLLLTTPLFYVVPLAIAGHWGGGLFDEMAELCFRFIVPFVPALLASPVLAEEIENKTFTFAFARPAPRSSLVLGKYVAVIAPLVVVLVPVIALGWLVAMARYPSDMADGVSHLLRVETAAVLGLVFFGAISMAIGTIFTRHPLFIAAFYVGYELLISRMPVAFNMTAMLWHLRNLGGLPLPDSSLALSVPAWVSALVVTTVASALLWLSTAAVTGAEYRTDR
jgi:ABC-2 type transport system permease protein